MRLIAIGIALMVAAGPAVAFQEQQIGSGGPTGAPSRPAQPSADTGLGISEVSKPAASGTEIRIPGLGKLGVIPKMDFGLELLYGATESSKRKLDERTESDDQQPIIRGAIKHKF